MSHPPLLRKELTMNYESTEKLSTQREAVSDLEDRIRWLQIDIDNNKSKLKGVEPEIRAIEKDIATYEKKQVELREKIATIEKGATDE